MRKALFAALLLATILPAGADEGLQAFLRQTLASARAKHPVPAIAALIMKDGRVVAEAAVGVRALGRPEPVSMDDRWHLGSDTKAFTSTMIARLVEQGIMGFDDTLAASFPGFAAEMDPEYRKVTVRQLLSHTAGLPPLTDPRELPVLFDAIRGNAEIKTQRAAAARKYLSMPPASKPGEFAYSNVGYIIAAAIAEAKTGKSWEELVTEQVFAPLGIRHAGFGAPGKGGVADEPRGHRDMAGVLQPMDPFDPESDNPQAMGPAGRINITLRDWARFAEDQLEGALGRGKLLRPGSYRELQKPVQTPHTGNYALGWAVLDDAEGRPLILGHTGSNGYWYSDVRMWPKDRLVQLIAINAGNADAKAALAWVQMSLRLRLRPAM